MCSKTQGPQAPQGYMGVQSDCDGVRMNHSGVNFLLEPWLGP